MEIVDHLERGIINLLDDSMADKGELQVYENSKFKGLFFFVNFPFPVVNNF